VAFEAFRAQAAAQRPSGRKSLWYALSIGFHGALIAFGIAYSFWHVEELSPPLLKVTFMSAAPPPPPAAPPPAGGGSATKKKTVVKPKTIVQPTKPEIVQPKEIQKKEEPREEPKADDHGEKDGVKGGVIGGTPGGIIGGTPGGKPGGTTGGTGTGGSTKPTFLPPNIGLAQKISGDDPPYPASLRKPGALYHVLVQFCVNTNGTVDKVTIKQSSEPQLNGGIVDTLTRNWRFRPYTANGTAIPWCSTYNFEFKTI
jgi:protein TonB